MRVSRLDSFLHTEGHGVSFGSITQYSWQSGTSLSQPRLARRVASLPGTFTYYTPIISCNPSTELSTWLREPFQPVSRTARSSCHFSGHTQSIDAYVSSTHVITPFMQYLLTVALWTFLKLTSLYHALYMSKAHNHAYYFQIILICIYSVLKQKPKHFK